MFKIQTLKNFLGLDFGKLLTFTFYNNQRSLRFHSLYEILYYIFIRFWSQTCAYQGLFGKFVGHSNRSFLTQIGSSRDLIFSCLSKKLKNCPGMKPPRVEAISVPSASKVKYWYRSIQQSRRVLIPKDKILVGLEKLISIPRSPCHCDRLCHSR